MLDRVSNTVVGLDGQGSAETFADYAQWEAWQSERKTATKSTSSSPQFVGDSPKAPRDNKKLSYMESREYAGIERRIAEAEQLLQQKRIELENPAIASDGPRLVAAHAEMDAAQENLDTLYSRWSELEEKMRNLQNPNFAAARGEHR
jgi:ATP-binding cassette subfamily F protein uup